MNNRTVAPHPGKNLRFFSFLVLGMVAFALAGLNETRAQTPTFQTAGAQVSAIGAVTVVWPAHAIDDIALLFIESAGGQPATLSTANGFAAVANSPQATGAGTAGTQITVFWARATSATMASPIVADPGNHVYARILTYRNVFASGNPWDVTGGGVKAVASASVTVTGVTTTVDNTLIVQAVARDDDSAAAEFSAETNAGLTSITERSDAGTTSGNGGGIGIWDGGQTTAGATGNTTATVTSSINAFLTIALRPKTTTLANGTDPANAAIGPGGAATMADAFTFQTSSGTDVITAVVVGLAAGTSGGLSLVEITDDAGTTVYGSGANPASDTPSITLSTNTLTATTTSTQYKIRVTPKSHANMPAPPGSTYSVTAKINSWTGTNRPVGSDTAGTTVTIDNASPANVTAASCTNGAGQVTLNWTNPADADFNSSVVLRNSVAVADTPVEGTTYVVGNTIGASTVRCVVAAPTATCTDSGLTVGTAYHYKIFSRDTNVNYSSAGVVPTGSPCTPGPSSFNVVNTGASPTAGLISTKIAGQDIAVDIVALNASSTLAGGFTGTVAVELVNDTGVACASLPLIKTLTSQTFTSPGDNGRHLLSTGQFEANAYRNLKFRITYSGASPTVTNCSSDAFANRPLQFLTPVLVQDLNRTTAGTTNTLGNTSSPPTGPVHNAGRPFRIEATARNGAGTPATTTLYSPDAGQPVAVLTQCGVAAVCPLTAALGTLTTGTFSAAGGVITTSTATYNDVGAFNLVVQDRTFTAVDSTDPGYPVPATHYISSTAVTVGRFVPDYFTLEALSTITPRTDIAACSASTFTYMDERMNLVFTLKARDSGNNVTLNYAGATLGALVLNSSGSYSFGAIDSAAPTPLTSRLDLTLIAAGATGSWVAGSASISAPLALSRAAAPDGPYASLKFGIAPSDPDGVTLQASALDLDADNNVSLERARVGTITPTAARFGRLRLQNALGSELIDLSIPMVVQRWNGTAFETNTNDSCTSLTAANLSLGAYTGGITGVNLGAPGHISLGGAFASGVGSLKLTKPSPVPTSPGSATVTVNLGAEAKSYLLGNWGVPTYTVNPGARAGFGLFSSQPKNFIFYRENY